MECRPSTSDLLDDLLGGLVPDEVLRVVVPVLGPDADRLDERGDRAEGAPAEPALGELFEPPLTTRRIVSIPTSSSWTSSVSAATQKPLSPNSAWS